MSADAENIIEFQKSGTQNLHYMERSTAEGSEQCRAARQLVAAAIGWKRRETMARTEKGSIREEHPYEERCGQFASAHLPLSCTLGYLVCGLILEQWSRMNVENRNRQWERMHRREKAKYLDRESCVSFFLATIIFVFVTH